MLDHFEAKNINCGIVPSPPLQFLVANSNSSFYSHWLLTHWVRHWVTSHFKGWEVPRVRKVFKGWKIFVDDEGSAQWAVRGVIDFNNQNNDYERLQRPFKNEATRSFPTLLITKPHIACWMYCQAQDKTSMHGGADHTQLRPDSGPLHQLHPSEGRPGAQGKTLCS